MGKRGFQQKGYPNPLLVRKKPTPAQPTDKSIKNYLSRPRPTLDEVKSVVAAKESKSKRMSDFEDSQSKDYRKELDKYRKKVLKREEKKKRKEEKKKRKLEKQAENKKKGKDVSDDSDGSPEQRTSGSSPVQLSKFFSFVGDDVSDGEIPLSDEETETPTNTTNNNPHSTVNTTTDTITNIENGDPQRKKRKRWDEKPAIFQNQPLPTPASSTTTNNPILQLPFTHLPLQFPFPTLLTPVQSNLILQQHFQIQQQLQLIKMQQTSLPIHQMLPQPTLNLYQTLINNQLLGTKPPP